MRGQFLVELPAGGDEIADLGELNRLFTAWVETVYHRREHSETGQAPLQRWLAPGPPALPSPAQLREAFLWSQRRTVTKTATVSLHGNLYEVDAALIGRRVELVFDPFDLTDLDVRFDDRSMGKAIPHRIGTHVHAKARTDDPPSAAPATGIDYLRLVEQKHSSELADRLRYAQLEHDVALDEQLRAEIAGFSAYGEQLRADGQLPGQLALPDTGENTEEETA